PKGPFHYPIRRPTVREARTPTGVVQAHPSGCRSLPGGVGMRAWGSSRAGQGSGSARRSVNQLEGSGRERTRDEDRSVAQLDMLHSLAAALNMLGDAEAIG